MPAGYHRDRLQIRLLGQHSLTSWLDIHLQQPISRAADSLHLCSLPFRLLVWHHVLVGVMLSTTVMCWHRRYLAQCPWWQLLDCSF